MAFERDAETVRLAELTAAEARKRFAEGPTILLPLGSLEDQGPHAPMGEYLSTEAIADRIAGRCSRSNVVVAPTLPFGGEDRFGSVPGGMTVSQTTLRLVLGDLLACLLEHDPAAIVILNGHGGNAQAIHDATRVVYRERGVFIPCLHLWRTASRISPRLFGDDDAARAHGHGADPLTSIAMHLFPLLVRHDLVPEPPKERRVMGLEVTGFGTVAFEGAEVTVPVDLDELAPDGIMSGDPRLCSSERGSRLVEALVDIGARLVDHVLAQQALPGGKQTKR